MFRRPKPPPPTADQVKDSIWRSLQKIDENRALLSRRLESDRLRVLEIGRDRTRKSETMRLMRRMKNHRARMAVQDKFQESLETISTHLEDAMMNEAVYQTLKIAGEFFSHTGGVNVESVDMASLDLQAAFDNVREITAAIGQELNSGADPTDDDELERELDEMLRAEQGTDQDVLLVPIGHPSPAPGSDVLSQLPAVPPVAPAVRADTAVETDILKQMGMI